VSNVKSGPTERINVHHPGTGSSLERMNMKIRLMIALSASLFSICCLAAEEKTSQPIVLSLPGLNWALQINATGFAMEGFEVAPDGDAAHFAARNEKTEIMMTGYLEKAAKKGNAQECRTFYWTKAQKSPFPKTDIKLSETGGMAIVEYMVTEFQGDHLDQKNINVYLAESDYWIDVHLSKTEYKPADQQAFDAVLKSVRIEKNYKPNTVMLCYFGSVLFGQKKYAQAATNYQQALNLETANRTLPRMAWLILVDQLGMSYGISGDIAKAKATYNAAIVKEPEYPMFYYNLACALAESNDRDGAIKNLNLAYKFKKNMLPGEELPNPRTDSSFARFLNDKTFIGELDKMK
jgi:tetratricopeptide (TPR) repeat protein